MDDNKKDNRKSGPKMAAGRSNKLFYIWLLFLILVFTANHIEYYYRTREISDRSKNTGAVIVKAEDGQMGHSTIGVDETSIVSDDGRTFSNETQRSIGKVGEYGQRAVWRRQGRFPVSRTVRLTMTDPVKGNLIRIAATPEAGY